MTNISWADKTWNPVTGCTVHSAGCTNCYAMKMAGRLQAMGLPQYQGSVTKTKAGFVWTGKIGFSETALLEPLKRRKPTTWFVNSMGDLFHPDVPTEWIDRVFAVMALCPQHTFQVLTKRPDVMRAYLAKDQIAVAWFSVIDNEWAQAPLWEHGKVVDLQFLPNVWLGVSVENQSAADERIPDLLATPAALRFLSCEPLLGPVDLAWALGHRLGIGAGFLKRGRFSPGLEKLRPLDWVIAGGESGPGARPMHPDWARSLRDQCAAAGVSFHFKQWGEWAPGEIAGEYLDPEKPAKGISWFDDKWDVCWSEPDGHCDDEPDLYRVGTKRAGRLLDGVLHNATPVQP